MSDSIDVNERLLIRKAMSGDATAIRTLYELHCDRIYAVVRRLAGSDMVAEDWAQEAWIRVFRALPNYRREAKFGTWAHRIAVNVALNGKRQEGRERGRSIALEGIREPAARPDRPLLRLDLREAIDRLPDGMRRVLVLHDVEGFTHEEIGEQLGISSGTCKSQLWKARAKLRAMLEPAEEKIDKGRICST